MNLTVPPKLEDAGYFYTSTPVLFGTPPQTVDIVLNLASTLLSAWSYECVFCPGSMFFDSSRSSTFEVSPTLVIGWRALTDATAYRSQKLNKSWPGSSSLRTGAPAVDVVSLGALLTFNKTEFGETLCASVYCSHLKGATQFYLRACLPISAPVWTMAYSACS